MEPETFAEASKDPHWVKAMEEEMSQIEKNKTWELVPHPKHKNLSCTKRRNVSEFPKRVRLETSPPKNGNMG